MLLKSSQLKYLLKISVYLNPNTNTVGCCNLIIFYLKKKVNIKCRVSFKKKKLNVVQRDYNDFYSAIKRK